MCEEIKHFDELIQGYIGPNKTVVKKFFTNLMTPGENYLSDMKKIQVVCKNNQTGEDEKLEVVAKCVVDIGFGPTFHMTKNEINFYTRVLPTLQKFQQKHGVGPMNFFPKYIGGRLNLGGTQEPDIDAVLVLENLKMRGYENLDRHLGFSLAEAKVIFKDLATFHSTALALKLLEPETFRTEIKDNCDMGPPSKPPPSSDGGPPPGPPDFFPAIIQYLKSFEKFSQVVAPLEKFYENVKVLMKNPENFFNSPPREPFATLIHSDMWLNNTMQKIQDGVVVDNKFVDFQICKMGSPAADLIFCMISSVQIAVLRSDFDYLIKYYYEIFSDVLKKYSCYGPKFSYEKFVEEFQAAAAFPIFQCMFMLPTAIFGEKGKAFDIKNSHKKQFTSDDVPKQARERLGILLTEASTRGWLQT